MINARTFIGYPTDFLGICMVYPPKVKDIISNDKYSIYQKILTITQEEIYDATVGDPIEEKPQFTISLEVSPSMPMPIRNTKPKVKILNPFEYLLNNCYNNKEFLKLTQEAFQFFTHSDIVPLYEKKLLFVGDLKQISDYKDLSQLPFLNEKNYLAFQNIIRQSLGLKLEQQYDVNEDPRVARMKAKARYRDKIKAKGSQSINLETMLTSICCMGIGITPLNIGELSYGAVQSIFSMYQNKEKYEIDIESLMAGADPKKIKPKHWITNLNE